MKEADGYPATDKKEKRPRAYGNSELFTVRLWMEELGEGVDYRGQVRHVVSGATRHFRKWADLEAFLIGTFDYEEGNDGEPNGR